MILSEITSETDLCKIGHFHLDMACLGTAEKALHNKRPFLTAQGQGTLRRDGMRAAAEGHVVRHWHLQSQGRTTGTVEYSQNKKQARGDLLSEQV